MSIPFVYGPYVYWKMAACQNVTPAPKFHPTVEANSLYLQAVIPDYTKNIHYSHSQSLISNPSSSGSFG